MPRTRMAAALIAAVFLTAVATAPRAQTKITSPREQFGRDIGDDYFLINYTQLVDYWHKLDRESDRLVVQEIGRTAEGRPQLMAIITSPENQKKLAHHKEIIRRLAMADAVSDDEARALAKEGKAVVWIDGGLHATEVLGAQQLVETVYRLTSRTDSETTRILSDDIVLCVLANPDGMELVSNWYMREPDERNRSTSGLPRLYQKYIGHDNNRDLYMMNMPESTNMNRVMYREWYPVMMYNHHQTGPQGAVLFAPPFRDPFNYVFDPLIPLGIELVGAAMHARLAVEGKPGAVMRSGAPYSTWFNGGLRTTAYFHNIIGLLTETIGNPTPMEIPFVADLQLPRGDVPNPVAPQTWHFRQSIEYSVTLNYAVLDIASKRKDDFLFSLYRMARNSIERGSRDNWTIHPKRIDAAKAAEARPGRNVYTEVLHDPAMRDPRGYIVPSDQPDFLTATKFVNTLMKAGVVIHRATLSFTVNGKTYPAGSYVVKTAQPFRPHVLDMFEPQDHPDDLLYPGGPPRAPYDVTGYTLALSMGVKFDRILSAFDGPFERLSAVVPPPVGKLTEARAGGGYLLSHRVNDAFVAVNRLLKNGDEVYWVKSAFNLNGRPYPAGTMFIPARAGTIGKLTELAADKGLTFDAVPARPGGDLVHLKPVRIGLWDQYGGSIPSGWVRWLLEQFEFSFEVVYPKTLDAGNLADRFDVLIFVDGGLPTSDLGGVGQRRVDDIPAEFRDRIGSVTLARTVPELKKFMEAGGTLLTIGGSTAMGYHLGLPIADALAEHGRALPLEKFYVPGSLLAVRIDSSHPLAYGMDETADVLFDRSPAFRLLPGASLKGVRPVAWFDGATPIRSGWAWGQRYLDQAVAIVDAPVGKGRLVMFGPEITWRAQPHGTFKLLFNGIYLAAAKEGS